MITTTPDPMWEGSHPLNVAAVRRENEQRAKQAEARELMRIRKLASLVREWINARGDFLNALPEAQKVPLLNALADAESNLYIEGRKILDEDFEKGAW